MDVETKEMLETILARMDGMESRFDEKLQQQREDLMGAMQEQREDLMGAMQEQREDLMGAMQEQREDLMGAMRQQKDDLMGVMQQQADTLIGMMESKIEASQRETMVFIENNVGKRIDSLFDGYKLTHEKQWELERRMERMEKRLSELENKAG